MRDEYNIKEQNPRKNPYSKRVKKTVTININTETIDYFRSQAEKSGIPYQTLINLYLTECAESKREIKVAWA